MKLFKQITQKITTNTKGVSLLELLVVIVISAIAGGLLIGILVQNNSLFLSQTNKIYGGVGLNDISLKLKDDIQSASFVAASFGTYTTNATSIVLGVPAIDASGNTIEASQDYVIYQKDPNLNNLLRRVVVPNASSSRRAANEVITNALYSLQFNYLDKTGSPTPASQASRVSFDISLLSNNQNKNTPRSISGQAFLRNITN